MNQPSVQLEGAPAKAPRPWYVITGSQKIGLLVLLAGLLYLRLRRREKARLKVCSHCGHRNAVHLAHCTKCSAPLFKA
ncbi:MAG TPA: hypothetical protein VJ486_08550 [Geothrix sp.]|nr:hypothetical protein [Geothrix sp.]